MGLCLTGAEFENWGGGRVLKARVCGGGCRGLECKGVRQPITLRVLVYITIMSSECVGGQPSQERTMGGVRMMMSVLYR